MESQVVPALWRGCCRSSGQGISKPTRYSGSAPSVTVGGPSTQILGDSNKIAPEVLHRLGPWRPVSGPGAIKRNVSG